MESTNLLPCPFCGGEAEILNFYHNDICSVVCKNRDCCTEGPAVEIGLDGEATAKWNTRHTPKRLGKISPIGVDYNSFDNLSARVADDLHDAGAESGVKVKFDKDKYVSYSEGFEVALAERIRNYLGIDIVVEVERHTPKRELVVND